jgi:hypothetical protein
MLAAMGGWKLWMELEQKAVRNRGIFAIDHSICWGFSLE